MKLSKLSNYRTSTLVLALAAAFVLCPTLAAAQNQTPSAADNAMSKPVAGMHDTTKDDYFNELNVSNTGKLTRDEMASDPRLSRDFDRMDTNHQGYVTRDEFEAYENDRKMKMKHN
jgi:hypothetical protein